MVRCPALLVVRAYRTTAPRASCCCGSICSVYSVLCRALALPIDFSATG